METAVSSAFRLHRYRLRTGFLVAREAAWSRVGGGFPYTPQLQDGFGSRAGPRANHREKKQTKALKISINLKNASCMLELEDYKEAAKLCTKVC